MRNSILVLLGTVVLSAPSSGETLTEALQMAEASNPRLEAGRTDTKLAVEALEAARAAGRTTVSITGSGGFETLDTNREFAFNTGDRPIANLQLEAAKPVYTGGRIRAGIRSARAGIDAADATLEALRQATWLETIRAYVNVSANRETVRIRYNNVELLDEQVRAARDRFEVGVVTRTDVALAEAQLEGARAGAASAEAQLEAAIADYVAITGAVPGELAPPPPLPALPETFDAALAATLASNPELEAARERVRQANEAIEAARANGRPTLEIVATAGGQQTFNDDVRDTSVAGLLRGQVPLWTGGQVASDVRSAILTVERARLDVQALERGLRAELAAAWYGYIAAERAAEASIRQVEAAAIAFDGASQELAVGTRTTLDVLQSEQNLLEARLSRVNADRDTQIAAYRLLQVMGALNSGLLGLG